MACRHSVMIQRHRHSGNLKVLRIDLMQEMLMHLKSELIGIDLWCILLPNSESEVSKLNYIG